MLIPPGTEAESFTEKEKAAATEQLERLLANPFFSHSRRFPVFLRFIVEQTLAGHSDLLKERTLGVEVFGKAPDYDTSSDPIVRVTAAEIRKRIALYYQEPGHADEWRLSLPAGSYVPQFERPHGENRRQHAAEEAPAAAEQPVAAAPVSKVPSPRFRRRFALLAGILSGILLCAVAFAIWRVVDESPVRAFWGPVLDSSDPALFCIADQNQYTAITLRDASDPTHELTLKDNLTAVVFDDLAPTIKFAGVLQSHGRKYRLQGEGSTTLADLRNGPDIFIGAFDNAWTLRLLRPLRFHFGNDPTMDRFWVADTGSHPERRWVVDRTQQFATNIYRDYAIVSRFTDPTTGRMSIVAAGIGRGGTIAAGELLTDPRLLAQVEHLPGYSPTRNIELVLSTQIIGGSPGTPHIEASYVW